MHRTWRWEEVFEPGNWSIKDVVSIVLVVAVMTAALLLLTAPVIPWRRLLEHQGSAAWAQVLGTGAGIVAAWAGLAWQVRRQHRQTLEREAAAKVADEIKATRDVLDFLVLVESHMQGIEEIGPHRNVAGGMWSIATWVDDNDLVTLSEVGQAIALTAIPRAHLKVEFLKARKAYDWAMNGVQRARNAAGGHPVAVVPMPGEFAQKRFLIEQAVEAFRSHVQRLETPEAF